MKNPKDCDIMLETCPGALARHARRLLRILCLSSLALASFASAQAETADRAVLSGLGPGSHYLRYRREAVRYWQDGSTYLREPFRSPFYVNGRLVDIDRATSPTRASNGREYQWVETGPLLLKDGDSVAILGTEERECGPVLEWEVATNRLVDAWYKCSDSRSGGSARRAVDFTDVSFSAGRFAVMLANRLAYAVTARVDIVVQDYWQKELAFVSESVSFDGVRNYDIPFAAGSADSYRARMVVTLPDGLVQERIYVLDAPSPAGPHRIVELNDGWSFAYTTDTCERVLRVMRETPPAGAKWSVVNLPHQKLRTQSEKAGMEIFQKWYRKTFSVPTAFRGERYVFRLERAAPLTRVYVNGVFCGSNDLVQAGFPLAVDVTAALVPDGENTVFLAMQGRSAFMRDGDLDTVLSPGSDNAWYGEWGSELGVIAEACLESMPTVSIPSAPRVVTSLSNHTVTVIDPPVPDGYVLKHRVKYRGEEVLPAFSAGTVFWPDPLPWGPTAVVTRVGRPAEFPLYELESVLSEASTGAVADRRSTRFGFREFGTRGRDFLWNGKSVKGVGRAMAPTFGRFGTVERQTLANHALALRICGSIATVHGRHTQAMLDYLDENGILAYQASYFSCNGNNAAAKYTANPVYWERKRTYDTGAVDLFGNHPAVYTWSLSGEFHLADGGPNVDFMRSVIRAVREKDPTRFCECGCDLDMHGETSCISMHYPIYNALGNPAVWLPDAFWWRPLDTPFTVGCKVPFGQQKVTANVSAASPVTWGRKPIVVHETGWDYFMRFPHGPTRMWGEEAYVSTRMADLMHRLYNNRYIEGHRDADCYMTVPWRSVGTDDAPQPVCPPVEVILCRKYRAFYEGTAVSIEADITHDVRAEENLDWYWELVPAAGGEPVASGGETLHADWGCLFRRTIAFAAPAEGRYLFRYGVRGKIAHETTMRMFAPVSETEYANVIEPGDPLDESVLDEVAAGGTAVLLARNNYPSWLPYVPVPSDCNASVNFTFRPDHPVLEGLDEEDFSYWYPDHATGKGYFPKPVSGGIRTILECGGPGGLVFSGLIEVPYGRGSFFYARLDLDAASRARNPVAAKLLANLAAYRANRPEAPAVLGIWPADNALSNAFARLGVSCAVAEPPYSQYAALWADGSAKGAIAFLSAVTSSVCRTVFVTDPTADFGVSSDGNEPYLYPSRAVKTRKDEPILRGLTNGDFLNRYWGPGQYAEDAMSGLWRRNDNVAGRVGYGELIGKGCEDLLYPRYLVRKGGVYFTTLAFHAAVSNAVAGIDARTAGDAARAARILTTLVANAGVAVTSAATESGAAPAAVHLTQGEIESLKITYAKYGSSIRDRNDFVQALDWYRKSLALDYNQPDVQNIVADLTALIEQGRGDPVASVPQAYSASGRASATTPDTAMDWSDARNWLFAGKTAAAPPSGARALVCFDPSAVVRFVRVPDAGASVGGIFMPLSKYDTVFLGGPLGLLSGGWSGTVPVRASVGLSSKFWVYNEWRWPGGNPGGCCMKFCTDMRYDKLTISNGDVFWRGDRYANGPQSVRDGDLAIGFINLSTSTMRLTGPTGSAAMTCTWSQTAGSPYVLLTEDGATFPSPGAVLSGAGISDGTFLRRTFPGGRYAELSAPATETLRENAVRAAAYAPRTVARIGTFYKNGQYATPRTFFATKLRADDDFVIAVSELRDVAQSDEYVLRINADAYPARIVFGHTGKFRTGIDFQNADIAFETPADAEAGLTAASFARVTASGAVFTCGSGVDAVVTNLAEVSAPLAKRGVGALRFALKDGCDMSRGALRVEQGRLVLVAAADAVTPISSVFVASGATLVLRGGTYSSDSVFVASGGSVILEDGARTEGGSWEPMDPIPDLGENPTARQIADALDGTADAKVAENVTTAKNYNSYREWAERVKNSDRSSVAGQQAVKGAPNVWLSFALGQSSLLEALPKDGDLAIEAIVPTAAADMFEFTVSLKDVEVGQEAEPENLQKVFWMQGAESPDEAAFSDGKVEVGSCVPEGGKVKFTAGPKDAPEGVFFMKVKMRP